MNYYLENLLKIGMVFIIFAVLMLVKNKNKKNKYGEIVIALVMPIIIELIRPYTRYLYFNDVVSMIVEIVLWLLTSYIYVKVCLRIYQNAKGSDEELPVLFKTDFKKWNMAVVVAIGLGFCSMVIQAILWLNYKDEYISMFTSTFNSPNFLYMVSGRIYTPIDILGKLNEYLKWIIIACMMIPAVIKVRNVGVIRVDSEKRSEEDDI